MLKKLFPLVMITLGLLSVWPAFGETEDAARPGYLGIWARDLDEPMRVALDFEDAGVLVEETAVDGPAARAGIKVGDLLLTVDGKSVFSVARLRELARRLHPGDKVVLKVQRRGRKRNLEVIVGEAPDRPPRRLYGLEEPFRLELPRGERLREFYRDLPEILEREIETDLPGETRVWLGIRLQELTPQLAEYFGVERGALVSEVLPASPAEKADLRAGDVIISLDGHRIASPEELQEELREYDPGTEARLRVIRAGEERVLTVRTASRREGRRHNGRLRFQEKPLEAPGDIHIYDFRFFDDL